jgi:hypothetical protein
MGADAGGAAVAGVLTGADGEPSAGSALAAQLPRRFNNNNKDREVKIRCLGNTINSTFANGAVYPSNIPDR